MKPVSEKSCAGNPGAERPGCAKPGSDSGLSAAEHSLLASRRDVHWLTAADAFGAAGACEAEAFPLLRVSNAHCRGLIALQGAQVLSFQPGVHGDLLWLSPNAGFTAGKAVRGGIPVCLPWFGVNQRHPDYPKHGFARTSRWRLEDVSSGADAATRLVFTLRDFAEKPHSLFTYPFEAQLTMLLGHHLELALSVTNTGERTLPLTWALHSYHPVDDLNTVSVSGLNNCSYLDNTRHLRRAVQRDDPGFDDEFDRVYLAVGRQQIIRSSPAISVSASAAPSAIVWNPGARLAAAMGDLGAGTHRQFVCLERGAAFDDEQTIAPGAALQAHVIIEALAASE